MCTESIVLSPVVALSWMWRPCSCLWVLPSHNMTLVGLEGAGGEDTVGGQSGIGSAHLGVSTSPFCSSTLPLPFLDAPPLGSTGDWTCKHMRGKCSTDRATALAVFWQALAWRVWLLSTYWCIYCSCHLPCSVCPFFLYFAGVLTKMDGGLC